ncbi:SDR family NAD(P)-dependent oxidoreductase [Microlunatus parietis]|uniref:NAD(P)-dependent dehydrogenase (Short-subunit alcohol dehydrogenase family) n=1 Tax=Microlunatus parietis TaxID=682979 RepID=A0A7Y9LF92_9ACTN|nr:SDR family NAD(P)-dependent oxidoreductase [Microlunatus parietis]NYE73876.1 NAD(P)-dependent dehydrogenase (short-subunit alcohol dehydrogenase family) [Microlunatus parietis]
MIDRVAVISGAGRGIGAATAAYLADRGWRIALLDLDGESAAARAADLGGDHLGLACDVADEASVRAAVVRVEERFGRIDAMIAAAGNLERAPAAEFDLGSWRRHLDIHLTGTFLLAQLAYPRLVESAGSVVTFASVAATFGLPRRVAYAAAKTGLVGMTRTLAAEWGPSGVRVNAVAPGYVDTEMIRSGFRAGTLDEREVLGRTPLRRLAQPEDIAAAIAFLISEQASFITGVMLPVDGGLIIDGTFDRSTAEGP